MNLELIKPKKKKNNNKSHTKLILWSIKNQKPMLNSQSSYLQVYGAKKIQICIIKENKSIHGFFASIIRALGYASSGTM